MKKILIVTVTAGEGHNSIAKALKNTLEENSENKVKIIDIFKKYSSISKQRMINEGYMAACKYIRPIYNLIYRRLQKISPEKRNKLPVQNIILKESAGLLQDIRLFEPDVIICTHFYGSTIISNLRKIHHIPSKTYSIVTDYSVHPFWEASIGIDGLIYPTEAMTEMLVYKGFKPEQLLPLGLPVKKEFSEYVDKQQARVELGLDKNIFTVLLMFGGGGFGQNVKIFKQLVKIKRPLQILVVNGNDAKSKKQIDDLIKKSKMTHKVFNYGFINFMSKIMSAADILVGKAGGISVTESLNKGLPMILSLKLAEQEKDNMRFLVENGAAISYCAKKPVGKILTDLHDNPSKIDAMRQNALRIRKADAINEIKRLVDQSEEIVFSKTDLLSKKETAQLKKDIKKVLLYNSDVKKAQ